MPPISREVAIETLTAWGFSDNIFDQYRYFRGMLKERGHLSNAEIKAYLRELERLQVTQEHNFSTLKKLLTLSGDALEVRNNHQEGLAWGTSRYVSVGPQWVHLSPTTRPEINDDLPLNRDETLNVIACVARTAVYTPTPPPNAQRSTTPLDLLPELPWVKWWAEEKGVDVHPKTAGAAALWEALLGELERAPVVALTPTTLWALSDCEIHWDARQCPPLEAYPPLIGLVDGEHTTAYYIMTREDHVTRAHQLTGSGEAHMALISRGALGSREIIRRLPEGAYHQTAPMPEHLRAGLALAWGEPQGWVWAPPPERSLAGEALLEALGFQFI